MPLRGAARDSSATILISEEALSDGATDPGLVARHV
jgi:hypothetical protein